MYTSLNISTTLYQIILSNHTGIMIHVVIIVHTLLPHIYVLKYIYIYIQWLNDKILLDFSFTMLCGLSSFDIFFSWVPYFWTIGILNFFLVEILVKDIKEHIIALTFKLSKVYFLKSGVANKHNTYCFL